MADPEKVRRVREATVREHMEAENALDFDRTLATFGHPRYELIPLDTVHDGAEEVMRYFRDSRTVFPDQRNELISLRHAEDAVVVEFWLLGTYKGGPKPTGRAFRCRMTAFFIFEGVDLVCERVYWDNASIRRQL